MQKTCLHVCIIEHETASIILCVFQLCLILGVSAELVIIPFHDIQHANW